MPQFDWDERVQNYRNLESGRFVSPDAVNQAMNQVVSTVQSELRAMTQNLVDRKTTISAWQHRVADLIKDAHVAAHAAATGGLAMAELSRPTYAGPAIKEQLRFLRGFAQQIESGHQPLDGRALNRVSLYGSAIRTTFSESARLRNSTKVFMQERRLLTAAEHCSDCVAEAVKGWQPKGILRKIGDSKCRSNCGCRFEFRRDPTSFNPCGDSSTTAVAKASMPV